MKKCIGGKRGPPLSPPHLVPHRPKTALHCVWPKNQRTAPLLRVCVIVKLIFVNNHHSLPFPQHAVEPGTTAAVAEQEGARIAVGHAQEAALAAGAATVVAEAGPRSLPLHTHRRMPELDPTADRNYHHHRNQEHADRRTLVLRAAAIAEDDAEHAS